MGKIILLNTPIGNLADLSPRVRGALESGELFAVEDTRVFKELLNHLGIGLGGKRIHSLHDQSGPGVVEKLLELAQGKELYLASEAGSPMISDPAYPLVVAALGKGFELESFSGVSAPILALELSGLPPMPFQFHGFLPRESKKKATAFEALAQGTHIFFEAPTRVEDTLDVLAATLPDAPVAVARELSKKFQQVLRFRAGDWTELRSELVVKGEFVLLVHQSKAAPLQGGEVQRLAEEVLESGGAPKALAKLLSAILERPTKDVYAALNKGKI